MQCHITLILFSTNSNPHKLWKIINDTFHQSFTRSLTKLNNLILLTDAKLSDLIAKQNLTQNPFQTKINISKTHQHPVCDPGADILVYITCITTRIIRSTSQWSHVFHFCTAGTIRINLRWAVAVARALEPQASYGSCRRLKTSNSGTPATAVAVEAERRSRLPFPSDDRPFLFSFSLQLIQLTLTDSKIV